MKNIKDILQEYNQLGIGEQIDYAKFYLYSIITHSTAIEGSTVEIHPYNKYLLVEHNQQNAFHKQYLYYEILLLVKDFYQV